MSDYQWPAEFWPHQLRACNAVVNGIASGQRRTILTAPCGCGKSKIMAALTEYGSSEWWNTILYTHRRMLLRQTAGVLERHGVDFGMRASGYKTALLRSVQLAMVQTERSAVLSKKSRPLHSAQLVLSDEIHALGGDTLPELHRQHHEQGAAVIGVTATPLDLVGEWDNLIVACTTSEGIACGALVPAVTYCPDEPDMKHIGRQKIGEDKIGKDLTDRENATVMMGVDGKFRPKIFGRVFSHYQRLNPEHKPTILFAPDVAGSIYFAEEFTKHGIRAAHIDAKQIWYNGEYADSDDENREKLLRAFESGEVQLLSNRFILREAIDLPCVAHAIFACVVGSLKSWLQMGGRAIRHHPTTPFVTIQDHGANFRRHGPLDADREWVLGMKGHTITGVRQDIMREHPEMEPITCPQCGAMRLSGPTCLQCGFCCRKHSRMVVQVNGELKRVDGPSYKPRFVQRKPDTERNWIRTYHSARQPKWDTTFRGAAGYFQHKYGYYPPADLPFMPRDHADWYERVVDVPKSRLT